MPIYTYKCECGHEFKELLSKKEDTKVCQKCGENAKYQLPEIGNSVTYEAKDKYRGKQVKKGLENQLKERMVEHHDRYELEEKIDKHGLDEAVRSGWTKKVKKV